MKKSIMLFSIITVLLLVVGCTNTAAKKTTKEIVTKLYQLANDPTITECVADYNIEEEKIVYNYCINTKGTLYILYDDHVNIIDKQKDGKFYEIEKNFFDQIIEEVDNPTEGYLAYKYTADELK